MPNVSHARYIAPLQAKVDHRLALASGLLRNPQPPISISNTVFTVVQTPNPTGSSAKMLDALCTCKPTYGSARPTGTRLDTGIPYLVLDMSIGIPGQMRLGPHRVVSPLPEVQRPENNHLSEGLRRVQNGVKIGPKMGSKSGQKWGHFGPLRRVEKGPILGPSGGAARGPVSGPPGGGKSPARNPRKPTHCCF